MASPRNSHKALWFCADPPEFNMDYPGSKEEKNKRNLEAVAYSVSALF